MVQTLFSFGREARALMALMENPNTWCKIETFSQTKKCVRRACLCSYFCWLLVTQRSEMGVENTGGLDKGGRAKDKERYMAIDLRSQPQTTTTIKKQFFVRVAILWSKSLTAKKRQRNDNTKHKNQFLENTKNKTSNTQILCSTKHVLTLTRKKKLRKQTKWTNEQRMKSKSPLKWNIFKIFDFMHCLFENLTNGFLVCFLCYLSCTRWRSLLNSLSLDSLTLASNYNVDYIHI